ncbi:hypothetical protein FNH22_03280 [Fulvivirga sp. M361]|uniref:hypothetical protein n=1 Tax=Fulvivirga sp. M361 TaxID=2594266 RepID=UPI00117B5C35|nr:hypothetical protein [Fulvivirga sp. M361]TRX61815.1 hypothetical protein FNH22_03280 [Fulvivirga sp. M361]
MTLKGFILSFAVVMTGGLELIGQPDNIKYYDKETFGPKLDTLRLLNGNAVTPQGDPLELAVNIALQHYPELKGRDIRIKYKKNVRHPITASWAAGNVFRSRKKHKYVLLIASNAFIKHISLNDQVGVFGHEMAHFKYYSEHPSIHMLWWAAKYLTSKKFHYEFEREADRTAIDHGLGHQLLGIAFYLKRSEIEDYMKKSGAF